MKLTITVEAPGPLTVTPPKPLLTKGNLWRVREDGLPTREVGGNREKWVQVYRLSPLVPGKPEIALGQFAIRDGAGRDTILDWNNQPLTAEVKTTIESPSVESLRPATDIEQLPPPPVVDRHSSSWLFAIIPALLFVAGVLVFLGRRNRRPVAPRDAEWANRELADPNLTADRCALILRQYLGFRFAVPAEMRTTPELANALRGDERFREGLATQWESLLAECDTARFSGTSAAVGGLADRARALVMASETSPPLPPSPRSEEGGEKTKPPSPLR